MWNHGFCGFSRINADCLSQRSQSFFWRNGCNLFEVFLWRDIIRMLQGATTRGWPYGWMRIAFGWRIDMRWAVISIVCFVVSVPCYGKYSGGSGDPNDPFLIAEPNDIIEMSNTPDDWDDCFVMIADVDLSGHTFDRALIAPDTDDSRRRFQGVPFAGVFDGNNFTISNLTINTSSHDCLGLFGMIDGPFVEVKNLAIEMMTITGGSGSDYVGGLAGRNDGSIMNCYSTGSVSGNDGIGGLIGWNENGIVKNCYSSASVSGFDDFVGGLMGTNYEGSVMSCYSTGPVSGDDILGGLTGSSGGLIVNCYSTGSVQGDWRIGGLIGDHSGGTSNCYSTGSITGNSDLGGMMGYNYSNGFTANCFWDVDASGFGIAGDDNFGATGKTTLQMQTQGTFIVAGWDFMDEIANGTNQVWQMSNGSEYPNLSNFNGYVPIALSGNGTESDPYLIGNSLELGAVYHYSPNASYRLTTDIDLSGIQWSTATIPAFNGYFDGFENEILNLTVDGGSYLGCFGYLGQDTMITSLGLEDVSIIGTGKYIGGLTGYSYYGTVSRCRSTGAVHGIGEVGGLVGDNHRANITNCYSTCDVVGISYAVGGLVGNNYLNCSVAKCYSTGLVSGSSNSTGGLVGINGGDITDSYSISDVNFVGSGDSASVGGLVGSNISTITNCYSTGDIKGTGNYSNGGLRLGGLSGTNSGNISNSFSASYVSGIGDYLYVGGLCGLNTYGDVMNNFWDTQSSATIIAYIQYNGQPDYTYTTVYSIGGIVEGKTTSQMQIQSTFVNWDFVGEDVNGVEDIWRMCVDDVDYPRLNWEYSLVGDFTCADGVGIEDMVYLAGRWLMEDEAAGAADADGDGRVDMRDFGVMLGNWVD